MSLSIHTWQWQWWKKIGLLWGCGRYRCASKRNAIFLAALPIVSWTSWVGTHNHRWQMTTSKCGFNQTWLFDPAIYFNESWLKKRKSISPVLDVSYTVFMMLVGSFWPYLLYFTCSPKNSYFPSSCFMVWGNLILKYITLAVCAILAVIIKQIYSVYRGIRWQAYENIMYAIFSFSQFRNMNSQYSAKCVRSWQINKYPVSLYITKICISSVLET